MAALSDNAAAPKALLSPEQVRGVLSAFEKMKQQLLAALELTPGAAVRDSTQGTPPPEKVVPPIVPPRECGVFEQLEQYRKLQSAVMEELRYLRNASMLHDVAPLREMELLGSQQHEEAVATADTLRGLLDAIRSHRQCHERPPQEHDNYSREERKLRALEWARKQCAIRGIGLPQLYAEVENEELPEGYHEEILAEARRRQAHNQHTAERRRRRQQELREGYAPYSQRAEAAYRRL